MTRECHAYKAGADASGFGDSTCELPLTSIWLRFSFTDMNAIPSSPIDRLQDDVLFEVFEWLAILDPPGPSEKYGECSLGWIAASHICQRWRRIILSMPLIWAKCAGTFPYSPHACEAIIERSGEAPLTFWPCYDEGRWKLWGTIGLSNELSYIANQHLERVVSIAGYGGWDNPPAYEAFAGRSAPQMRVLYVFDHSEDFAWTEALDAPRLEILMLYRSFFNIHAPSLRSLRINLTHGPFVPSYHYVLDLLEGCSLLEELNLSNLFDILSFDQSHMKSRTKRMIELPRLTDFRYSGEWLHISSIWRSIKVATLSRLCVELPALARFVLPLFPDIQDSLRSPENDTLYISFDMHELHMHVYASHSPPSCVTVSGQRALAGVLVRVSDLVHTTPPPVMDPNLMLAPLIRALNGSQIHHLDLNIVFNMPNFPEPALMRELLHAYTRVEALTIGHLARFEHVASLLRENQPPVFPQLHTLILKNAWNTMPGMDEFTEDSTMINMKKTWEQLSSLVSSLHAAGRNTLRRIRVAELDDTELSGEVDDVERYVEARRCCVRDLEAMGVEVELVDHEDQRLPL
ncbi:unnamed protein product [Peniophora sp. CBMAI 1063]|nr:unnamed protein product [Peniophora sp. CBMAI 1063]